MSPSQPNTHPNTVKFTIWCQLFLIFFNLNFMEYSLITTMHYRLFSWTPTLKEPAILTAADVFNFGRWGVPPNRRCTCIAALRRYGINIGVLIQIQPAYLIIEIQNTTCIYLPINIRYWIINTLRPIHNGHHFANDILNLFSWMKMYEFKWFR